MIAALLILGYLACGLVWARYADQMRDEEHKDPLCLSDWFTVMLAWPLLLVLTFAKLVQR